MSNGSPITPESGNEGIIRSIRAVLATTRVLIGLSLFVAALVPFSMSGSQGNLLKTIRASIPLDPETISPAAEGKFLPFMVNSYRKKPSAIRFS